MLFAIGSFISGHRHVQDLITKIEKMAPYPARNSRQEPVKNAGSISLIH